jgi:hypothetical protein
MCCRQFVGTARLGKEVPSYYIRLVGRASCTSALNLIAAFPPRTVAPTVHFQLLCLQLVGSFMRIMHHGQMVGMASRATGEIFGPWDATQVGGWHSHLGRRVLSQVPVPGQFEPFSHVGVVSKYLCTAIPKWRSRQLVGTIRSRGAV